MVLFASVMWRYVKSPGESLVIQIHLVIQRSEFKTDIFYPNNRLVQVCIKGDPHNQCLETGLPVRGRPSQQR